MSEYYMATSAIVAAFILDLILGERRGLPHPVIFMGRIISRADGLLNRECFSGATKRAFGLAVAVIVPLLAFSATFLVIKVFYYLNQVVGALVSVLLAYTTLSLKGLKDVAMAVERALRNGDIQGAREALSHMVGRDTGSLEMPEIVRGTIESVAENTSDGVIAPLFFLVVGGAPLAMAYKAVNTLDSMLGYKNERYADFGRASARLDDFANHIPARLAGVLMVVASFLLKMDWRRAWLVMIRDSRLHPSPNAGYPEAAAAGAIRVRLGGSNSYFGKAETRPFIGDCAREMAADDINSVVGLMYLSSILMLVVSVGLRGLAL
ncbi:MAG: adenosylcobinamide-phosphate synthase CbiB [Deltaproteobacteria bacterium]